MERLSKSQARCKELCGMLECGNRYCSYHPKHYEVKGTQPFEKPHRFKHRSGKFYN